MADDFDRAGEYLRVREHYLQLSDGELLSLSRQQSELTEVARHGLASEIFSRGLKPEPEETPATQRPEPPPRHSGP